MSLQTAPIYGYLVHVTNTIIDVTRRTSSYNARLASDDLDRRTACIPSMLCYASETYRRECGMSGLRVRAVWVGYGTAGFCWSLPDRMMTRRRTEKDAKALEALKKVIGVTNDPTWFASIYTKEPAALRNAVGPMPKILEDMLPDACCAYMRGEDVQSARMEDSVVERRSDSQGSDPTHE